MARKKKAPPDERFDPVGIGGEDLLGDEESVVLLRSPAGGVAMLPRSLRGLRGEPLEVAAELQGQVVVIAEAQQRVEGLVREARDLGLSWNSIGWCVGTTGDAARRRWGMEGQE